MVELCQRGRPPDIIHATPDGRWSNRPLTSAYAYRMIVDKEKEDRRTLEQNAKLWAMLGEISEKVMHGDRHYSPDQWKVLFMHAWGQKWEFLPALDNPKNWVPYGTSSSKLTKAEMIELIEFIAAWAAQNGVAFRNDPVIEDAR
jgi:hypothetical protein